LDIPLTLLLCRSVSSLLEDVAAVEADGEHRVVRPRVVEAAVDRARLRDRCTQLVKFVEVAGYFEMLVMILRIDAVAVRALHLFLLYAAKP